MTPESILAVFDVTNDGRLFWKPRGPEQFKDIRSWKTWTAKFCGKEAGSDNGSGYFRVWFAGRSEYVHRIVFVATTGLDISGHLVDHKDGNTKNNHPSNLRLCNKALNGANRKALDKRNKSGVTGVHFCTRLKKWWVQARVNGKPTYIGTFTDFNVAVAASKQARRNEYGDFAPSR